MKIINMTYYCKDYLFFFSLYLYDLKNKWDPQKIKGAIDDVDDKNKDDDEDENENGVLVKLSTCAWEDPS